MKSLLTILFLVAACQMASAQTEPIDLGTDTLVYQLDYEYVAAIETAEYMESYVFYRSALKAYTEKDLFSAKVMISKAIKLNKKETKFKILKAWILSKDAQYNKSIKLCNKILNNHPKLQEAIYCRGLNYHLLGSYNTAIANYNLLLTINKNDHKALMGRAEAKIKLKQFKSAIIDYTTAIQLQPNTIQAYKGRGLAYYNSFDFKSAIRDFNQMIVAQPNDGQMYFYRAMCNLKLNDYTKACQDFESAVQLKYKDAESYLDKNCRL